MTTDTTRLDGQVAIVTGAAQGVGMGIAQVLAGAGAMIIIGDIQDASTAVASIRSNGAHATSMVMDISVPGDAQALADFALREYGRLDILVNNAAIDSLLEKAWDMPDDDWERTIAVNLSGVFYCSKAALVPMLEVGKGNIVNISAMGSFVHRGETDSPAYAASKAGVVGLTTNLAAQVSRLGIRVNAVVPSTVESVDSQRSKDHRTDAAARFPLGLGRPEDVGEAVRYLVSPAARWVSGTTLEIHGGGAPPLFFGA